MNKTDRSRIIIPVLEHGKLPPQAIDLEELILGAIILESDAYGKIESSLRPEVFYKEAHQKIFKAILDIKNSESGKVDLVSVTQRLKKNGDLELVGGPYYVTQLTSRIVTSENIEYHALLILEKFMQRELIRISSEIIHDAFEDTTDVFDLFDRAKKSFNDIEEINISTSGTESISDYVDESVKQLVQRKLLSTDGKFIGIDTGILELNKTINGWQPGLIILAARPSMGKTAMGLHFAKQCAVHNGTVKIYEMEMSAVRISDRLLISETEVDIDKFRSGYLEAFEFEKIANMKENISRLPILINDKSSQHIDNIIRDAKYTKRKNPDLSMIIVDHLTLMQSNKTGNRSDEIGETTRKLKGLSKDLNIPVICLCQLSREVDRRTVKDKRPILSDLRSSGEIEQDADIVMFIYRPEYYGILSDINEVESYEGYGELVIAKNRDGLLKTVKFNYKNGLTKFFDYNFKYFNKSNKVETDDTAPF
jgi:replicative DNA helicase